MEDGEEDGFEGLLADCSSLDVSEDVDLLHDQQSESFVVRWGGRPPRMGARMGARAATMGARPSRRRRLLCHHAGGW